MGRGKVNGQLSVVTSVGRKRMGKALAVQSGRALPMGRCASPPCVGTLVVRERMRKAPTVQSGRALPMGRCAPPPPPTPGHNPASKGTTFKGMVVNYGEGVGSFRIKYELIKLILKSIPVETFLYLVIFESMFVFKCTFGKIRGIFLF